MAARPAPIEGDAEPVELLLALNSTLVGLLGLLHGPDEVTLRMATQVGLAQGLRAPVLASLVAAGLVRALAVERGWRVVRLFLSALLFLVWCFVAALYAVGAPDSGDLPSMTAVALGNAWATFRVGVEYLGSRRS